MEKAYSYIKGVNANSKTAVQNAAHLVEGSALLIAAYYNYLTAHHAHGISSFELKVRVAASVVIGLRGAYELGRWLANKEVHHV